MAQSSTKEDKEFTDILGKVSEAWSLTESQRDKSNESIRFVDVPGAQWEGSLTQQFANRPRMELDKVSQAVNLFNSEWRTGRFGVNYRPDNTATSDKDAELLNGLFRKDWRKSNGDQSMDNNVSEMSKGGVGALRLKTEFVIEDDPENKDQHIIFEPIHNAYNTLVWDPQAKTQDKMDAGWAALIVTYTQDAYKEAYPGFEPTSAFQPSDRNIFNFNNLSLIYVTEYYKVNRRKEMAFGYVHKITGEKRTIFKNDLKENDLIGKLADSGFKKTSERRIIRKTIEKSILYGGGFIEKPRRIIGDRIPIAPCYGYRSYVDGQEFYYGLVEKHKDAQRLSNMAISNMAELAATSPKSIPIFTPEQVVGLETRWSEQHLGKQSYALLNSLDDQGKPIPLGPIQYLRPAEVDNNTTLVFDLVGQFIQNQSGGMPRDVLDPDASGKAIEASILRVDMQTQTLMDNISQCLKTVGEIYLGMASEVYDNERFVKLVNDDGTDKQALLLEYVLHPTLDRFVRINDVKNMKLEVIVDTGPTFATQRRSTVSTLSELLSNTDRSDPMAPLIQSSIIQNIEGAGLDDIKKFSRKQMILQGITEPETPEEEAMLADQKNQQAPADAGVLLAAAEQKKADVAGADVQRKSQADQLKSESDQVKNQISGFKAETERMGVQIDAQEADAEINNKNIDGFGKQLENRQKQVDLVQAAAARLL